jgi:adenylate cyclase
MRREHAGLVITALLFIALTLLEFGSLHRLGGLDQQQVDAFVRRQALPLKPDSNIVIVDIDEASLANQQMAEEAGSWPWPRAIYAELIDKIEAQKPSAIVFDILFSEGDHFRPESDAAFVDALRGHDNIYLPMLRLQARDDVRGVALADMAPVLGLQQTPAAQANARAMLSPPTIVPPELWRTGVINFNPDADGVARSYWLSMDLYGWLLPSLPARLAKDKGWTLPASDTLELAWRGPKGSFRHVSFADVYQDLERSQPLRWGGEFASRIVIIGTSASGLNDLRVSPRSSVDEGVEILATAIDNLKNGHAMSVAPRKIGAGLALLLILGQFLVFLRRGSPLRVGLVLSAVSLLALAASWYAVVQGWRLPVLAPLMLAWAFYLVASVLAYLRERAEREKAVQLFGRFLNKEVVKQLVERGETIESLSGQSRELTLLFSDIRGFTSLSEKRRPEEVVAILNRYFSKQVAVVFRHGGTLDKFIGDCIMAFWGAPLSDPEHAKRAVACALEMEQTLQAFRQELGEDGVAFDVGIGVHTGTAVVGFIGAEQKQEYTAIGDTVNLASRVEGLTKGVARILVTAATAAACKGAYAFTPRGAFAVKGRAEQVELFEPRAL